MAPKRPRPARVFPQVVDDAALTPPNPNALYAALDLGTNSCRMLIAQPKGSQFHVVDSFSKSVQLGVGLEKTGKLSRTSMNRTIQALKVCHQKLKRHNVTRMRLVATEACRRHRMRGNFVSASCAKRACALRSLRRKKRHGLPLFPVRPSFQTGQNNFW